MARSKSLLNLNCLQKKITQIFKIIAQFHEVKSDTFLNWKYSDNYLLIVCTPLNSFISSYTFVNSSKSFTRFSILYASSPFVLKAFLSISTFANLSFASFSSATNSLCWSSKSVCCSSIIESRVLCLSLRSFSSMWIALDLMWAPAVLYAFMFSSWSFKFSSCSRFLVLFFYLKG